jgi:iron complex transport system substrate-binding protein
VTPDELAFLLKRSSEKGRSIAMKLLFGFWIAGCAAILFIALYPPRVIARAPSDELPSRAAIIYPPAVVAYLTAAESARGLLAISEQEHELLSQGLFGDIFPSVENIGEVTTVGNRSSIPNDPEQVLRLSPDRIVTWRWAVGGLDKLGIPLTSIDSPRQMAIWKTMAIVAGHPERFNDELASFKAEVRNLDDEVAALKKRSGVRAIIMWRANLGSWRIASLRHEQMSYLLKLGVSKPFEQDLLQTQSGSISADIETILAINPDVIFLTCCAPIADTPETLFDMSALRSVNAIRTRRVYKEPIGGARMDGLIEWPLLLRWFAELLYPGLPRSFRADFKNTYQRAYGFSVSDQELDQLIFMIENSHSSNYDRFAE